MEIYGHAHPLSVWYGDLLHLCRKVHTGRAIDHYIHLSAIGLLLSLAFVDPGILKKNLKIFYYPEFQCIPVADEFLNGEIRYHDRPYQFPIKSHQRKVKFCRTCMIYRPPVRLTILNVISA
jgi:hypothetical protein